MSAACKHRHWLPLICHRDLLVQVCLNCGTTRVEGTAA